MIANGLGIFAATRALSETTVVFAGVVYTALISILRSNSEEAGNL